jgi:hypothetical protein
VPIVEEKLTGAVQGTLMASTSVSRLGVVESLLTVRSGWDLS